MKTTYALLLALVTFGLGLFMGTIKVQSTDQKKESSPTKSKNSRVANKKPAYTPDPVFPAALEAAGYQEKKKLIEDIAPQNRFAHIQQLLALSGPDGLDYKLETAITNLLELQFEENPQGTLDWVLALAHIGNRDFLFEELIDFDSKAEWVQENFDGILSRLGNLPTPHDPLKALIKTKSKSNPLEAIKLSKELLVNFDGKIDYPSGLQESAATHSWQAAFEYLKDSWKRDNDSSMSGWTGDFPDEFDFASFATAWQNHEAGLDLSEDDGFYEPPNYFWKAWSERDPEAAFSYLQSKATRTFEFDDFFEGYSKVAEPDDLFDFSKEILMNDSQLKSEIGSELFRYLRNNAVFARQFSEWTRNTGDRALSQSVLKEMSSWADNSSELGQQILGSIPSGERLQVVRTAFTSNDGRNHSSFEMREDTRAWLSGALEELGHGSGEIEQTLAGD